MSIRRDTARFSTSMQERASPSTTSTCTSWADDCSAGRRGRPAFALLESPHHDYNSENQDYLDDAQRGPRSKVAAVQLVVDNDGHRCGVRIGEQNRRDELSDS